VPDHASATLPGLGGFLPFELPEIAPESRPLMPAGGSLINTGRNALLFIARALGASTVHLPILGCDTLASALGRDGMAISWYRCGRDLLPERLPPARTDELVVVTDLFGLVRPQVEQIATDHSGVVLDLTHSVLDSSSTSSPWFASYRKTIGLADGALAVVRGVHSTELEPDESAARYLPRLERIDRSPEAALAAVREAEAELDRRPVLGMSKLTEHLLASVDRDDVSRRRRRNAALYDDLLRPAGLLPHPSFDSSDGTPFSWPLITEDPSLVTRLHSLGVYVPVLWPHVPVCAGPASDEAWVAQNVVHLPVDQHMGVLDIGEVARRVRLAVTS